MTDRPDPRTYILSIDHLDQDMARWLWADGGGASVTLLFDRPQFEAIHSPGRIRVTIEVEP